MDKKTRNILIVVALIVVVGPVLLVLLGLGGFFLGEFMHSDILSDLSIATLIKYIGIAIIVIGVPLVLFFTRKKKN